MSGVIVDQRRAEKTGYEWRARCMVMRDGRPCWQGPWRLTSYRALIDYHAHARGCGR